MCCFFLHDSALCSSSSTRWVWFKDQGLLPTQDCYGVALPVADEQQVHWLLICEQHSLLAGTHRSHSLLFVQVPSVHSVDGSDFTLLSLGLFGCSSWRDCGLSARAAPWDMPSLPLLLPFKISKYIHGNCSSCLQENKDIKKFLGSPSSIWCQNMGCKFNVSQFPGNHDHLLGLPGLLQGLWATRAL